ncbi:YSIRK-targeted triacylglycerol lipase [Staphylococcus epidermidis]|uniref:YSIRK-targeted triacylglycerol lipase n=1 Tax=Staphylococcus epidermidis TaxID=1282 RepID=UPI0011AA0CE6|nr:YSIRK-type signal peptide-containing protein [Staphylococcus epidermidis]MBM0790569.1 YSIRK-type signal peptide-containing protein [Staphylococcus epidermidis]MBM6183138.1 YSIRK-type signal peptide-containing protein [Staphylococcus epidermidis]MBM6196235.1 YSIRK-type signal peptide-containing protein [Staphylococcus epidermidis]MBM6369424.1 YSIRK-type signal peptide-containing protein [Staphylococcus epidermidis]MCD9069457.1 YSIRK-type signal peptide-containing protein [Staphylococcus epid
MKNKKNSYSIRKLSVGASSIIVASMLFIGGGSVHAAESNHLENQEQSEVSASHSIELQHKDQEIQQPENKDNKNYHSETIDKNPTIHNNDYSYHETPSTDVKSNEGKQIDSQSNQPQTSMTKNDQQNPKKVAEHTTKGINAKKEETRKNENAKSLVKPQQDDKTTSEQTKMKESREQEITNEQKQLQSKDVKNAQQENQNIEQEKSQEKINLQQSSIEKVQKSSRIDGKLDHQYNKDATQSNEDTVSENVSEQHITAKDEGVTRNNRGDERLNQEKSTTSDKELKVDDIDKDLSTKESPENEKDDSRKGIKALTKNSQATTRNTATTEASKELKDQTNKVASQKEYKNQDPIILVHGFNGYASGTGPITGKGNYWGGDRLKIIQDYRAKGYNVMEASVSAFGSNYDRAVELYYYIKGGRVDYGAAHAAKYGHERYGKTYAGAYKDWKPGQKIHLIGHSMGGQTIRYLEELLRHGSPEEVEYQKQHGGDISPLYKGGQDNMISSITTIATPHNGTHAADLLGNEEIIRQVAYDYARSKGNKLSHVDVGLSQWGLKQREDETLVQYIQRVKQSKLWTTKDNGFYDLTTEGTDILNQKTSLNPNIVYKTYQGESTRPGPNGTQKADVNMNIGYTLTANTIGKVKDKAWRENDGLVSVISGQYPLNQAHTSATDQVQKGVWQVTPVKHNWDHGDFVGTDTSEVRISKEELEDFWDNMFEDMVRNEKVTDKQ